MRPRELFVLSARFVAFAWAMLCLGLILKYVTRTSNLGVRVSAPLVFTAIAIYLMIAVAIGTNHRWHNGLLARAALAGLLPFGTLWFARWAHRRRELSGDWRLGRNGSYAYTWTERVLAFGMRRPGTAIFLSGVLIALAAAIYWRIGPNLPIIGD